ncbi:MAG TPA: ABC-type transport auxiliary lipoprotein family protein [Steroidobacteraceae bacterium]|jgi:cholesterol transport system auxiliary component|nr:ABC-type transport auxiliary lipoprotein family protein [Steroidobacteraceae bacterium]
MMIARRDLSLPLAAAALGMSVASCSVFLPARVNVERAVLDQMPMELPQGEKGPASLLVYPPETAPRFDTPQMAYRTDPHQIAFFTRREWAETPSQMLHPLLLKALEESHSFSAVLVPPYAGHYTYALRTQILELTQDFTSATPLFGLTIRIELSDYAAQRVIATKEISLQEPMQGRTSYAGVAAANLATARALRDVAAFLLEQTDKDSTTGLSPATSFSTLHPSTQNGVPRPPRYEPR